MNAERLLRYFDRIAEAPDAIPCLRRFILDLAVRGKLVPQDPNDESALDLLGQIAAEKERLVKEGKRRTADPLRIVSEDDAPFVLPSSWVWTRIGEIFNYDAGQKRDPHELTPERWLLELEDIGRDTSRVLTRMTVADRDSRSTKSEFQAGDILYGKLRPYLNKVVVANEPGYSTTEIVAIRPFLPLCSDYCCLAFRRPDFVDFVDRVGQGTKMPRLRTQDALMAIFPLPPLAEQYRIVTRVEELMALCDQLEAAKTEREQRRDQLVAASLHRLNHPTDAEDADVSTMFRDHAHFYFNHLPQLTTRPEHIKQLRQTILNLAARGRLVEQDPNDEPASELLNQIRDEQSRLVKAGKMKVIGNLPPVIEAEAPFCLPKGWTWARFPEIGILGRGKSKHRPRNDPALFENGTHLFVQTGDVARSRGTVETYSGKYNEAGLAQSAKWPKGTLCITIAANIADSGILAFDACFPDSVVGFIPASMFPNARYFEYFIRTAKADLLEYAPATAQKNINLGILNAVLIPLPPLAEQLRIVARADELMAICDQLEAQLAITGAKSRDLLEAVLHEALSPALEAVS